MIIPIRCYTCNKILANLYNTYLERVAKKKIEAGENPNKPSLLVIDASSIRQTIEGEVMNDLGVIRICCRKIFLGQINLIDEI